MASGLIQWFDVYAKLGIGFRPYYGSGSTKNSTIISDGLKIEKLLSRSNAPTFCTFINSTSLTRRWEIFNCDIQEGNFPKLICDLTKQDIRSLFLILRLF